MYRSKLIYATQVEERSLDSGPKLISVPHSDMKSMLTYLKKLDPIVYKATVNVYDGTGEILLDTLDFMDIIYHDNKYNIELVNYKGSSLLMFMNIKFNDVIIWLMENAEYNGETWWLKRDSDFNDVDLAGQNHGYIVKIDESSKSSRW